MFPTTTAPPPPPASSAVPPHVQLFLDVKRRLLVDNQVTFEESGRAFLCALERAGMKDEPETQAFIEQTLPGCVDIFLQQVPSVVSTNLLFHFEDVLRSAAKIISQEIRRDRVVQRLDVLARILDEANTVYQDRKVLLPGGRKLMTIRNNIAKDLATDGTFVTLLGMLRGQVKIRLGNNNNGEDGEMNARIVSNILAAANNSKLPEVNRVLFADSALQELRRYCGGGNDALLRKQKAEDLHDIHVAMMQIYGGVSEEYFALSLELWLKCLEMDTFVLKRYGLDNLIRVCVEAAKLRGSSSNQQQQPNSRWDDATVCRWLVERKVLESLFGSQTTHSALIGRSKSLLEHMAVSSALGPEQIDYIFQKVGERNQHEADSGAVQSLLAELVLDLAGSEVSLLILKRAGVRSDDMYAFARKLTEHSIRNRGIFKHDLQVHILDLLWSLLRSQTLSATSEAETEERREQILLDFSDALRNAIVPLNFSSSKQDVVFNDYLAKCLQIVVNNTNEKQVWTVCSVLKDLILLHPDHVAIEQQSDPEPYSVWRTQQQQQPEWTKQSQVEFVSSLDSKLLDALVKHLEIPGQSKPHVILDLVKLLVEKSRNAPRFSTLEAIWKATPLYRLQWFQVLALPFESRAVVFSELICKLDVAQLSSGFDCFAAYFTDTPQGVDTLWRIAIETKLAEVANKASQMLLVLQRGGTDKHFFSRVMDQLKLHQQDDEKQHRCIQLAISFLDSQVVLNPHMPSVVGFANKLVVHHDGVFTFSDLDLGKAVEKRFKEGKSFCWCAAYIYQFSPETGRHAVCMEKDYELKTYDFRELTHEGALHGTEKQYRMLSVADGRHEIPFNSLMTSNKPVADALRKYHGITLEDLDENTTVREIKDMVIGRLGRPVNLAAGDSTEIQIDLGQQQSSVMLLPQCVERRGEYRVAVRDESLPIGCLVGRFGSRWFLSVVLRPSPAVPVAQQVGTAFSNAEHFDLLLNLATTNAHQHGNSGKETWQLLMNLPTEPTLLARIGAQFGWKQELENRDGVLAKVYLLQIADRLSEKNHDLAEFYTKPVAQLVIDLFSQALKQQDKELEWERNIVLQITVRLLRRFALHHEGVLPLHDEEMGKKLASQLTQLLCLRSDDDLQVSLDALCIAKRIADKDTSSHLLLLLLGDTHNNNTLADILANSRFDQVRAEVHALLLRIAEKYRDQVFTATLHAVASSVPSTNQQQQPTSHTLSQFIMDLCLSAGDDDKQQCCSQLMPIIRRKLATDSKYLDLCRFLVEQSIDDNGEDSELVETVLKYVMVDFKRITSSAARQQCFALLTLLAQKSPGNLKVMECELDAFVSRVEIPLARHGKSWDFHFRADDSRRGDAESTAVSVGLINQGATCYQNSVLQQLFMRPKVRDLILTANYGGGGQQQDDNSPLFRELQRLFAFLNGSEQRWYNPTSLVLASSALRLTDGHLSQNDCAEFFTLLVDHLEEHFPKRDKERLHALFFSSTTSLTMRTCPEKHRSERTESTLYISLSIRFGAEGRALNSLDEALDEWSRAEHLTELICEDCKDVDPKKQRFDGDQIKFISRFPPILVLQLKRFDFDYETLQPFKLNHRVSFKQRLDMGRFSREAVLRKYEEESSVDEQEEPIWYKLKGVVVHQGTGASFGHYYSFIENEQGEWFRFDDERVTPFDCAMMEEECFGGPQQQSGDALRKSGTSTVLRNNNCYLLVYEKEDQQAQVEAPPPLPQNANKLSLQICSKLVFVVQQWRRRVARNTSAMRALQLQVEQDNQRSLCHSIAFAPDFVKFCSILPAAQSVSFALHSMCKLALFAESEKDALLDIWLPRIQRQLEKHDDTTKENKECCAAMLILFVKDNWVERLLAHGADLKSSKAFTDLCCLLLSKVDSPQVLQSFAQTLVAMFPKQVNDVFRLIDANYFLLLGELCKEAHGGGIAMQQFMIQHDMVLRLIRLVVDDHNNQAVREHKFCSRIVSAIDAILLGGEGEEEESVGFPLMSTQSSQALFADSFCAFLVQFTPRSATRLLPRLCDCNLPRMERCLEVLVQTLHQVQWISKVADAPTIVPDTCELLQHMLLQVDSGETTRKLREGALEALTKIAKEAKRAVSERKDTYSSSNAFYNVGDKREGYRCSVLLLFYLLDLFNALALRSDAYRSYFKAPQHKWPSFTCALDVASFEQVLDGNEQCGLRELKFGQIVRTSAMLSVSLGHLPRPILLPSRTLSLTVEGAGMSFCNGTYRFAGFAPAAAARISAVDTTAPRFTRVDPATNKRMVIYRCHMADNQLCWFLAEHTMEGDDIDCYQTRDLNGMPDNLRWQVCNLGHKPAPRNVTENRFTPAPSDDVMVDCF